jgi:hypothetical protein
MRDDGLDPHMDHISRLFRACETITASTPIRAAWRKTGFEYKNSNMMTYLSVNERQIRPILAKFGFSSIRRAGYRQSMD